MKVIYDLRNLIPENMKLMKRLLAIFLLGCSTVLIAQNWSPILVNEKVNYQHSDSSYISHTIWVDSAFAIEADSIFYLNRIVKDVSGNPEIVLRNQPQFLMEFIVKQIYGIYTFEYPNHYTILTQSNVGGSWEFTSGIQAEITEISFEVVFGVLDSVKVISLSDGNEIRLSKNFGILIFPDFENEGYYELVGIQITEYGESVPDFWDIFDFEVGDVFQYSEDSGNPEGSGFITRKLTITSKQINSNSYQYSFDGIYKCVYFEVGGGGGVVAYTYTDDITYIDSLNHPANKFPLQICEVIQSASGFGTYRVLTLAKIFKDTETNNTFKEFGLKDENFGFNFYQDDVYFELDLLSDTLYRYDQVNILSLPCGLKGFGYGNSIGKIFSNDGFFEFWEKIDLVGYVKDGDTVGTITPDSLLLVGLSENKSKNRNIMVYPNPATEILNINQSNHYISYNVELRNLYGQLVKEVKNIQSPHYTLNVADLKTGIYFYEIKEKNEIIQQGKLIIK